MLVSKTSDRGSNPRGPAKFMSIQISFKELSNNTKTYDVVTDNKVVIGSCQFRLVPKKSDILPIGFESHIYYEIDPEYQNKGYASITLGLLLNEARKEKLNEVILTVKKDNLPSQKVITKNGGKLLDTQLAGNGTIYHKYKITL